MTRTTMNFSSFFNKQVIFCCFAFALTLCLGQVQRGPMCTTLPSSAQARLVNPCVGIVNYPYFIPAGYTDAMLLTNVTTAITSSLLALDVTCQENLLRYVCAKAYLRCVPGAVVTDPTTFKNYVYPSPFPKLPVMKPCETVCTSMKTACGTGLAKLNTAIQAISCTEQLDYSNTGNPLLLTTRFYTGTNASLCNAPTLPALAKAKEMYADRTTGFCKGVVNEFFVPPANKIDARYTPLQPPKVVQTILNTGLASTFSILKPWIDEDCMLALREYQCNTLFMTAQQKTLAAIVVETKLPQIPVNVTNNVLNSLKAQSLSSVEVTLPQYPHYQLCKNYESKCGALIAMVGNPRLVPYCNITSTSNGLTLRNYPAGAQIVNTYPLNAQVTLKMFSHPNKNTYYNTTEYTFQTQCPTGFVVPEHPDEDGVQWVGVTGCSVACQNPVWNQDEWTRLIGIGRLAPTLGTLCGALLLLFLALAQEIFNSYHITFYAILSLTASAYSAYFVRSSDSFTDRVCYDNAINIDQDQGSSPCVTQGVIIHYTYLACSGTIALLSLHWALKFTKFHHITNTVWYFVVQVICIFVLPVISVAVIGGKGYYGYSKAQSWCFIRNAPYAPKDVDVASAALVILIIFILTHVVAFGTDIYLLVKYCRGSAAVVAMDDSSAPPEPSAPNGEQEVVVKKDDTNAAVMGADAGQEAPAEVGDVKYSPPNFAWRMVVLFSIIIFIPFIISRSTAYYEREEYLSAFEDWATCVFTAYDGTDASWMSACGGHVKHRPPFAIALFAAFYLMGNNIIVMPVFVISYVCNYFYCRKRFTNPGSVVHRSSRVVVVKKDEVVDENALL